MYTLYTSLRIGTLNPPGQDNTCKTTSDFVKDLNLIKKNTGSTTVRIYTTSQCDAAANLLPALKQTNTKAIIGIWPTPPDHFDAEIKALTNNIKSFSDQVVAVTVGSEVLYRKEMTAVQLAAAIDRVRTALEGLGVDKPVGTADSWNLFINDSVNPVIKASDIILANAFSYWQGMKMDNATHSFFDDIMQALQHVQDVKKTIDVDFWVGETNWPTGGADFEASVPSVTNAAAYWKDAVCGMLAWGINVFIFEAFDEPWKPAAKNNDVEQHWGAMDVRGSPKYDLSC